VPISAGIEDNKLFLEHKTEKANLHHRKLNAKQKKGKHAMSREPTPYRAQQEKSNPLWKEELMLFLTQKR
jgi:hypothetical protein